MSEWETSIAREEEIKREILDSLNKIVCEGIERLRKIFEEPEAEMRHLEHGKGE